MKAILVRKFLKEKKMIIDKMEFFWKFSIPKDQFYFVSVQILALIYAFIFRQILLYHLFRTTISKNILYILSIIPGLIFSYICFGNDISHLIFLAFISYLLLLLLDSKLVHLVTLLIAMSYLSYIHLNRLVNNSILLTYQFDISGPMMVLVEKITSIAFSIHDGSLIESKRKFELTSEQRHNSLRQKPSFLQYCSYLFDFQTMICGPLIFYVDYQNYLDGIKLKKYNLKSFPPVIKILCKQLLTCLICALFILKFTPLYPVSYLRDQHFCKSNLLYKLWIIYLITLAARFKYYFAWKFSESICDASGLAFNGFIPITKQPKYDLGTNIEIFNFEMALSQRDAISAWNVSTAKWLRVIAHDRTPKRYKVICTYILSAIWHGFFPGYYLTFATGGLFTLASRSVRKCLRYRFTRSYGWMVFYHSLTWLTTRIMLAYCVFPFILLDFWTSIDVFKSVYWFGHLMALFSWFILPYILTSDAKLSSRIH